MTFDVTNLDPAIVPSSFDVDVSTNMFEGLVTYKPGTWEIVNQLAETFEPSEDGTRFAFTLKQGIPFHGGYGEVTAEDVKFSYERIAGLTKPKVKATYASDWAGLEEVEVTGVYSGVIVLSEPSAPVLTVTLPAFSGWIVSKAAAEELGKDFGSSPIGTGPYEFTRWDRKEEVLLTRFTDWGGASRDFVGEPAWDELSFVVIEEDNAADIALESGAVDFGQISLPSVSRFEDDDAFEVQKSVTLGYMWIGMNMENSALQDLRVRQAIRYAIDVPSILAAAFEDRYDRALALIPPEMGLGYWAEAPVYDRNLDEARRLLAEAGAEGLSLTFTITKETGSKEVAEITQANLAEVGVDVQIDVQDAGTFYDIGPNLVDRQLFFTSYFSSPDPSFSTEWFTCDQLDAWNWMYWCSEEYSQLHVAARSETDPDARQQMYERMQELWDEAAHTVWLAWPTSYTASRAGLTPSLLPNGRPYYYAFTPA
jgi:peptide/nickel transport system substrate-binding protein